jgi:ribokinase
MIRWRRGRQDREAPASDPPAHAGSVGDTSPGAEAAAVAQSDPARPAVIVIGAINVDLVIFGPRLPEPGETVIGNRFGRHQGGKGGNQAVAAARALRGGRLDGSVAMIAAVGDDQFGREAVRLLEAEGVDCSSILVRPDVATGVASIVVDASGANMIALAPGANGTLTAGEAEAALARLVGPETVVLASLEVPLDAVLAAAYVAAAAGARFVLNPAPAPGVPPTLIHLAHYLTPNEVELNEIVPGFPGEPQVQVRNLELADRQLHVAVTLGAQGVFASGPDGEAEFKALHVKVVDTTGAGDAFNGAFAAALAEGRPFLEAVRRGRTAGGLATTKAGAREAMPTAAEIDRAPEPR